MSVIMIICSGQGFHAIVALSDVDGPGTTVSSLETLCNIYMMTNPTLNDFCINFYPVFFLTTVVVSRLLVVHFGSLTNRRLCFLTNDRQIRIPVTLSFTFILVLISKCLFFHIQINPLFSSLVI